MQVSESAASGTALFSGVKVCGFSLICAYFPAIVLVKIFITSLKSKVNSETVGLNSNAVPGRCMNSTNHNIDGLLMWAQNAGMVQNHLPHCLHSFTRVKSITSCSNLQGNGLV